MLSGIRFGVARRESGQSCVVWRLKFAEADFDSKQIAVSTRSSFRIVAAAAMLLSCKHEPR